MTGLIVEISYGFGVIGVAGIGYSFIRYSDYKTTVKLQNDNIKALRDQADTHTKEIAELKARNDIVEKLPLEKIFTEIRDLHKINSKILKSIEDCQK